jgi:hypothetical protein
MAATREYNFAFKKTLKTFSLTRLVCHKILEERITIYKKLSYIPDEGPMWLKYVINVYENMV